MAEVKKTVEQEQVQLFIKAVGSRDLMREVGVGPSMLRMAVMKGKMPPGWYRGAKKLAAENNIAEPPDDLFDFNVPVDPEAATAPEEEV